MFRKVITSKAKEQKDRVKWRSHEVTRIEAFSDAVFAFAVTLLIVSLEVPPTLHALIRGMRSFLPFAICFAMLFQIWLVQNIFFRRYGLSDSTTIMLNAMLLFTVLFFVYPLKFLFSTLLMGESPISNDDWRQVFFVYSGGYAAIYLLFTAMYWNAYRHRDILSLSGSEAFETVTNIYRNLAMGIIGLLSVVCAAISPNFAIWAWIPYLFIGPVIGFIHGRRSKIHRRIHETPQEAIAAPSR